MSCYNNGRELALIKIGLDTEALKAFLMRSALGTGAGAAAGGVIDSENPLRGAALGAAGGMAGHGLGEKLVGATGALGAGLSPLYGAAGGGLTSGAGRLIRDNNE